MQVKTEVRRIGWMLLCLVLSMPSLELKANRPVRPGTHSEGVWLERQLTQAGVATDFDSLLRAARTSSSVLVRSAAVELLGLRQDRRAISELELVYQLDEEPLVRQAAALALARMAVPGAIDKLEECLRSARDSSARIYLATRLAELGNFVGYPHVVAAVRSEDPGLRQLAAASLVRFSTSGFAGTDSEATPITLLGRLLADPQATVRREAIQRVSMEERRGFDADKLAATIAEQAKTDPDPEVRREADLFLSNHKSARRPEGTTP